LHALEEVNTSRFSLLGGIALEEKDDRFLILVQAEGQKSQEREGDQYGDVTEAEVAEEKAETPYIADPLERWNRAMFLFNDKLYFWVLEPVTRGYRRAVSEDFRVLFANFYRNVMSPIRIVNSLLQFKLDHAGTEFARLVVNSTIGVGGLRDVAGECFGIREHDEDFGQTLGFYRMGPGFYLVWPVIGPSTVRDTLGYAGDLALNPRTWFVPFWPDAGMYVHDKVNSLSFHLGEYESMKKAAVDPYIAVRSGYVQYREAAIDK
jgi:phospholipid-binding lipoprotein MlaA